MDKKLKAQLAAQRGLDRAAHFANGGTVAAWRGRHTVQKDRKKEKDRRACRGRYRG